MDCGDLKEARASCPQRYAATDGVTAAVAGIRMGARIGMRTGSLTDGEQPRLPPPTPRGSASYREEHMSETSECWRIAGGMAVVVAVYVIVAAGIATALGWALTG